MKITNKRSFYLSQDWAPDGLKVAMKGPGVTSAEKGVDVIAPIGELAVGYKWTGPCRALHGLVTS